jgi:hypothetical protein
MLHGPLRRHRPRFLEISQSIPSSRSNLSHTESSCHRRWRQTTPFWLIVLNCCWLAGCGSRSYELETAPVTGNVTVDGKMLDRGTIVFVSPRGRTSSGEISSDGTFKLSTYSVDDGAIVGENKVAVFVGTSSELDNPPTVKSPIPERYSSASTSGLSFEVKARTTNEFSIALKNQN